MRLKRHGLTASALRIAREITAETSQPRAGDWNKVRDLESGSRVRVTLRSGVFKEGRLAGVEDDRLVLLSPSNSRMVLARADITEVSRPMRGSIVGGLLGTAVGGFVGFGSAITLGFKQCGLSRLTRIGAV